MKARSQRSFYGTKAKLQQKTNRAKNLKNPKKGKWSDTGYNKIMKLHGMFLFNSGLVTASQIRTFSK